MVKNKKVHEQISHTVRILATGTRSEWAVKSEGETRCKLRKGRSWSLTVITHAYLLSRGFSSRKYLGTMESFDNET